MNLAVRLYQDASPEENPGSIPGAWPMDVRELGEGTQLPTPGTWQLMTAEEYNTYRAEHQAEYDAWEAANELPPVVPGDDI